MFPKFVKVKQNYSADKITDIPNEVKKTVRNLGCNMQEIRGKTVGIAVGSRGISNIAAIVRTVVDIVKENEGHPIIFAAMGSHGGSTPLGQKEILESLGITEESMGAEIRISRECVLYGITEKGMQVFGNKIAFNFDKIILINRVKQHTDFEDITESGLLKLLAIGIGNHEGAVNVHANAVRLGYGPVIRDAAELMLKKLPVLFGIAITENWRHETNNIVAVYPDKILDTEMDLLKKVKESAAKLPIDNFDSLIVEEAGKNISGTCLDTKVIGRIMIRGQKEPETPNIKTIAVLDFTDESHGNSMGLGVADIITQRVFDKIDIKATSLTGMTSTCLLQAKIPCVASNDLEAIDVAFTSAGVEKKENVKAIYIKNTNSLEYLVVTENIYEIIKNDERITKIGEPFELEFDETGTLITKVFN